MCYGLEPEKETRLSSLSSKVRYGKTPINRDREAAPCPAERYSVGTRAYNTSKPATNGMRERWWISEVVGVILSWPEWFPSDFA